jgi:serine/threonine protein kinase
MFLMTIHSGWFRIESCNKTSYLVRNINVLTNLDCFMHFHDVNFWSDPYFCKFSSEYRIIAKKGKGTFSEVLKAQCLKTSKLVAIKCMKNTFDSLEQVFCRENKYFNIRKRSMPCFHEYGTTSWLIPWSGHKPSRDSGFTKACSSCQYNQAFGRFIVRILFFYISVTFVTIIEVFLLHKFIIFFLSQ